MSSDLQRRVVAEALGSALLLATVVGSGIMAQKLAGGNVAVALLGNTIPTGAILVVLIMMLGPVSGAHFNPAVTGVMLWRGEIKPVAAAGYLLAQLAGGIAGTIIANLMFDLPGVSWSTTMRAGSGQWLAEVVATAGLILTILGVSRARAEAVPFAVGLYITAAYWFTASTSFANPAVTVARMFSDTFAGIAPASMPGFVLAQGVGAVAGVMLAGVLWPEKVRAGSA